MSVIRRLDFDNSYWKKWLQKWFPMLLVIGISANVTGLFVTILEPDGALYAMIAKTIAQTGDYINLKVEGKDWLDKPHFPFWITALSFKIFGISTFAYKIPALIFWAAGGLYTFLFAKETHNKHVALLSVLIYVTAAHLILSNNDVRAEPYLTGLIIGSVYHFYRASGKNVGVDLVAGSLLAACAVMTKGPFVLITISSGFVIEWILKKDWKQFIHYRWWLATILMLVFILPEIYCLYHQFNLQPEKIIFGRTGVSGIRFFFWDSQFGRFLNTGPIKGKGDLLFYLHTLLWAFLPWSLLLFTAIFYCIRNFNGKATTSENITLGASLVTFLLFSLSRFQLPHYMNIVFPFFAIITAKYIHDLSRKRVISVWFSIQSILLALSTILLSALAVFFNVKYAELVVTLIVAAGIMMFLLFSKKSMGSVVGRSFMMAILLAGFLNLVLYPALLNYQSGSEAAAFINHMEPGKEVCTYDENSYSFAFYLDQPVKYIYTTEGIKAASHNHEILLFTSEEHLDTLSKSGLKINVIGRFAHFHISKLTGKFLNDKTRQRVIKNMVVAKISSG